MTGIRPFLLTPVFAFLLFLAGCDNAANKVSKPEGQGEPEKEPALVEATSATTAAAPGTVPAEKPGPTASAVPATLPAPQPPADAAKASGEADPAATADIEQEGGPAAEPAVSDMPVDTAPPPAHAAQPSGFAASLIQLAEKAGWTVSRDEEGNIFLYPRGTAADVTR